MSDERFSILFDRMTRGELSPAEKAEIGEYFASGDHAAQAREMLDRWYDQAPAADLQHPDDADRLFNAIVGRDPHRPEVPIRRISAPQIRRILIWTAACAVVLVGGWYFLQRNVQPTPAEITAGNLAAVQPGKTGAILTLADGTEVELDSLGNAVLPPQPGAGISVANGQLSYNSTGEESAIPSFNTMKTPKGRQFAIRLPDGTKAWLNAASSLRYPTAFQTGERRVSVTGEAYFEVAANAGMPFVIDLPGRGAVEVLGTNFNVHAYENDPAFTTTLIRGAVRVKQGDGDEAVVLKPGQEAIVPATGKIEVRKVDVENAVMWKEGFFSFDQTPLPEVLKQLERWYDIEVEYQGGVPDLKFSGELSRTMDFTGVLRALERTNVHFRYEHNRKLIVIP